MNDFTPTEQQRDAINYVGSMVITACPGSGKTTVMKEKIRKTTLGLPDHKGVIAITFTKKASKELENKCKYNAHDIKNSFFGTIDSFCLKEILLPFLSRVWGGDPHSCKVIKRLENPYKQLLSNEYQSVTCDDIKSDDGFKRVYESGILWMNSFAGLALYVLNSSKSAQRYILARYSHVFIDEYQDSSSAQHRLFLKLLDLGLISTVVGDVWQSIYEFRGGNAKLLNDLVVDNEKFHHFEMNQNWRCHASIVNYASRLLNSNSLLIPCDQIKIFRRTFEGDQKNAANIISDWIVDWLRENTWGVKKASDIAVLARKDSSLKLLSDGLSISHRVYSENQLEKINSDCSEFYSAVLAFRYGAIPTIQEFIDTHLSESILKVNSLASIRRKIKVFRHVDNNELLIANLHELAVILGVKVDENSDVAVREILQHNELIKKYKPLDENEIQVMTLHKSKGLEFKVVFHFDLEEWSFPFQQIENNDWDNPIFPSLAQDTNLHYVGITRAENCCILVQTKLRQKANGDFCSSKPSYFLNLPQLEGLYK